MRTEMSIATALLVLVIAACSADIAEERVEESPTPFSTQARDSIGNPPPLVTPTPTRPPNAASQKAVGNDPVFIQLKDPLDEPEYYCVDVPGAGRGVRLDSDLQAHTCKPISEADDELFTINHPNEGQIYMEAYGLCVEVERAMVGASIRLQPCSNSPHQLFELENDLVRLGSLGQDGLCLAVAPGFGIPTGGPSHLRRALTLERCDTVEPALARWSVGLFDY